MWSAPKCHLIILKNSLSPSNKTDCFPCEPSAAIDEYKCAHLSICRKCFLGVFFYVFIPVQVMWRKGSASCLKRVSQVPSAVLSRSLGMHIKSTSPQREDSGSSIVQNVRSVCGGQGCRVCLSFVLLSLFTSHIQAGSRQVNSSCRKRSRALLTRTKPGITSVGTRCLLRPATSCNQDAVEAGMGYRWQIYTLWNYSTYMYLKHYCGVHQCRTLVLVSDWRVRHLTPFPAKRDPCFPSCIALTPICSHDKHYQFVLPLFKVLKASAMLSLYSNAIQGKCLVLHC